MGKGNRHDRVETRAIDRIVNVQLRSEVAADAELNQKAENTT